MSHGQKAGPYILTRAVGPENICALLRAVDAAEADTFGVLVVQNFDGVAVEDEDDGAGEVSGKNRT